MKTRDLTAGETYWYDSANDWASATDTTDGYRSFAVRLDDVATRYLEAGGYHSRSYVESPRGDLLKGTDLSGKTRYVQPRNLRTTYADMQTRAVENRVARAAQVDADRIATNDAFNRARAIRDRLDVFGISPSDVHVHSTDAHHYGSSRTEAKVAVTVTEAGLTALLDRLDARFLEGFQDGEAFGNAMREKRS